MGRALFPVLILVTSLGIGAWAYRVSRFEALIEWERTHYPPAEAWRNALEKRGFHEVLDPRKTSAVLAALPVEDSEMPIQVWRDRDWAWVVFVTPEARGPHFFCAQCEFKGGSGGVSPGIRFQSLDTQQGGWPVLGAVIAEIDASGLISKKSLAQNKQKALDLHDPREVFY